MVMIMAGRRMRRKRMADRLTFREYFVSGRISPMLMPTARSDMGMAEAPSSWIVLRLGSSSVVGMWVWSWVMFRNTPRKTAMTGPFRKILGLSENLPVKIMTPIVNMASSTPRL